MALFKPKSGSPKKPPVETVKAGKGKKMPAAGTQVHLRLAEIRDNVLILKNGGLRTILKASSINFNLKSEEEQNAIIYSYQSFLNTLEFPIQIVVRSKKLDIDNYIENLRKIGEKQENPLLQKQTYEYLEFVAKLVEYAEIMEKEFYIVVPYDPFRSQKVSFIQKFFQNITPKDSYADIKRRRKEFEELKKGLTQRVNVVKTNLENCGLKIEELSTQEIIELFYNIYNPIVSRGEKMKNTEEVDVESDELKKKNEEGAEAEAA